MQWFKAECIGWVLSGCWLVGCSPTHSDGATNARVRAPATASSRTVPVPPASASSALAGPTPAAAAPTLTEATSEAAPVESLALFHRYPTLAQQLPWVHLTKLPTPVERLESLERKLKLAGLFIKRDDVSAPEYGGGKPRKLEFLLGEAQAAHAARVITWGGAGSNQAVAVAAHAARLDLAVTLLLLPQRSSPELRNNLLAGAAFGAELRPVSSQAQAQRVAADLAVVENPPAYVVPMGGSSPLGNVGFVNAGFELDEQIRSGALPEPDAVYIAMGTMGSAIGLLIGLMAAGRQTRVVAVRASSPSTSSAAAFRALFEATVEYLVLRDSTFPKLEFDPSRVELDGTQLGRGYGRATAAGQAAVSNMRRASGLVLETTYTGKALAALMHDEKERGRVVLFWNTHNSQPLPNDPKYFERLPAAFRAYFQRGH